MNSSKKGLKQSEFTGLRGVFWPIHNYEVKKFLPMGLMMLFILFNYTVLRDVKDTLVVNMPAGGAECIPFLKVWGVTPSAILFMIIFTEMANFMKRENLFYSIILFFLIFFGAFGWVIYPHKDLFHMTHDTVVSLQTTLPDFMYWFIPVIGNWSFALFYILAELWGGVVVAMLFWQFANEITKVDEAKRFYGLFGLIGNLGLILSGSLVIICSRFAKTLESSGVDAWEVNLKWQMSLVVLAGLITLCIYRWMNKVVLTDPRFYEEDAAAQHKEDKLKLGLFESFRYLLSSPYLLLIAVLVVAYGLTINLVEGVWLSQIKILFPKEIDYQAFMGQFSLSTGIVTIILMIVGNNILRRLSWYTAAIITPLMVLITSTIFFGVMGYSNIVGDPKYPILGTSLVMVVVIVGQVQNVLSKATKYSLFDSTKQMAYIPLDPELKVKGQAAVEVVGGRAGKSLGGVISSILLSMGGAAATLSSLVYILGPIVVVVSIIWCFAVGNLSRRFTELVGKK